jgi:dienelactone hydrolase
VDPGRNAAIGYCFGGSVVLEMARAGADLAGVVSFHGGLGGLGPVSDHVTAKVLVANGADDPMVTAEQIATFRHDMDVSGADYRFIDHPGATHGFTNRMPTFGEKFGMPLHTMPLPMLSPGRPWWIFWPNQVRDCVHPLQVVRISHESDSGVLATI